MTKTLPVHQKAQDMLRSAYGFTFTPKEAANYVLDMAEKIRRERSAKFDYSTEALEQANRLHNESMWSINRIAVYLGCDRKTLRIKMLEAGCKIRGQKESQEARRELEKAKRGEAAMDHLSGDDVRGWDAHQLFRSGK